jgi:hypothetical protein
MLRQIRSHNVGAHAIPKGAITMSEDTIAIVVGTLIPFALSVLTRVDYSRSRAR